MIQCPFINPTEPLVRAADFRFSDAKTVSMQYDRPGGLQAAGQKDG